MKVIGLRHRNTALLVVALLGGCSSPGPETSSSSHWVSCTQDADCATVPGANSCEDGYCVDSGGARVEVTDGGSTTGDAGATSSCDPFASPEVAMTLATYLGGGEDADGISYVADRTGSTTRLFVSDGDQLHRVKVTGTGSGDEAGKQFELVTFERDGNVMNLYLTTDAQGTAASLIAGNWKPGSPPSGTEETPLTFIDEATARTLDLAGWTNETWTEYFMTVKDTGEFVVVTRPEVDWTYEDFRLFFGEPGKLVERPVSNVTRARDGGSTTIEFELDGKPATASFPFGGSASITVSGTELSLVDPASLPAAAIDVESLPYECLASK